jgi:hypothetical protein
MILKPEEIEVVEAWLWENAHERQEDRVHNPRDLRRAVRRNFDRRLHSAPQRNRNFTRKTRGSPTKRAMERILHHNKHLTDSEIAILKAWAWESGKVEKEGPAHKLLREHGITIGGPLALMDAANLEILTEEIFGERISPIDWPWGDMSKEEICRDLRERVAKQILQIQASKEKMSSEKKGRISGRREF